MTTPQLVTITAIIVISIIRYFEPRIAKHWQKRRRRVISVLAGASIVIIFAELLNDIYLQIHSTNNLAVLCIPLALIFLIYIERHIRHHLDRKTKTAELETLTTAISFISGLLVGILAAQTSDKYLSDSILFLLIIIAYDLIRSFSLHVIHPPHKKEKLLQRSKRLLFAFSPLYGYLFATSLPPSPLANTILFSFFGGGIIYVIFREVIIPQEEKFHFGYFLVGAGGTALLTVMSTGFSVVH